jgi:hypothetical protein
LLSTSTEALPTKKSRDTSSTSAILAATKLEKSEIIYHISFEANLSRNTNYNGTLKFDNADKGEITIQIDSDISDYSKFAAFGDELEQARQYENGEIGAFKFEDGKSGIAAYDEKDEGKSQDAGIAALKSNGYEPKGSEAEWEKAKTDGTQKKFFEKYKYNFQGPAGTDAKKQYEGEKGEKFLKDNPQVSEIIYRKNGKTKTVAKN